MSKRVLTPEQEKTADKILVQSGLKGALIGLGIGAAATAFVRGRSPEFRALSRPIQSIMAASSKFQTKGKFDRVLSIVFSHYCWVLVCI